MKAYSFFATMLLCLMPYMVAAQGTDVNSRDLRGKVVYQDDEVVFRQLDEHTWIGNGHRVYNESLYIVEGRQDCGKDYLQACHNDGNTCPWRPCGWSGAFP